MDLIKIYFILGLAMVLVVLWDYKTLPETARRLTKHAQDKKENFSRIAEEIRNWAVMVFFAFFLWPMVLLIELFGRKEK